MMNVLGLPLAEAMALLSREGLCPLVERTAGRREAAEGTERVVRISGDGRRLTVARFPDGIREEEENRE